MRLISYNILDGGEGRADPIAEVIEAQRPDVVCLVEADDTAVLDRIARRLDFELIHAPGNTHAAALLSRWPIRESINHAPLHKDFEKSLLEATVVEPATNREWTVGEGSTRQDPARSIPRSERAAGARRRPGRAG